MALCARRGCPEPAAFVPRLALFSATRVDVPRLTDRLETLPHCYDCTKGVGHIDDLLGPGSLDAIANDCERAGKVRPVRAEVLWEGIRE